MLLLIAAIDPADILKVGISGLIFFLSLWTYRLISQEQKRPAAPRKGILKTIYIFMTANLVFSVLVGASTYLQRPADAEELTKAHALNSRYREVMTQMVTAIDLKVETEAMNPAGDLNSVRPSIRLLVNSAKIAKDEKLVVVP